MPAGQQPAGTRQSHGGETHVLRQEVTRTGEKPSQIAWRPLRRTLNFQELINQDRKNDLEKIREDKESPHRPLPPDLAAAVHAHLDYRLRSLGGAQSPTALNRVADRALHYCELMLYERRYIPKSAGHLKDSE